MALAVVRDLSEVRTPASPEELEAFETDVLAGFVLARASARLADGTIRGDMSHLEQIRSWFGRPLWDMQPADADACFGRAVRSASQGTRLAYAQSLSTFFHFLEMRYRAELHAMTGTIITCPLDEMNRPRGRGEIGLRIPPTGPEVEMLFAGWREDLTTCRKFVPVARNYTTAKLISLVGLRINEARRLDLNDVRWELGRFGKLHVRFGRGAQGSGPRQRVVPLIKGADRLLRWYIEDLWGYFDDDHTRPGHRYFPPSAATPTALRPAQARTPCAADSARPSMTTCPAGPTGSLRTSCGTSALPSSTATAWTCSRSRNCWGTGKWRPQCGTSTSCKRTSRTPGPPVRNAPPPV
ncbi:site-specific integrase [Streptomyces mirabilis]|uniref:Phage integrase family protein n=1 Tax=Streptomyces mirabilis TaxID=68239 RepID=A0A1I2SNK4_9ACTN|nr:hypothetical protein SAMN02787118_1224 [Streptomyces mirabilis]